MGTTTNLSLPYPASTDYVANGYLDIQNLADAIDALFGTSAAYTPTTTNISTGTVAGNYLLIGKWLFVFVIISGGTATANGTVALSLPAGVTGVGRTQPLIGAVNGTVNRNYVATNGTDITITKDGAGANWSGGNSLVTTRVNGWIEIQ